MSSAFLKAGTSSSAIRDAALLSASWFEEHLFGASLRLRGFGREGVVGGWGRGGCRGIDKEGRGVVG